MLANKRHEKFAQLVAGGMKPHEAYRALPGSKAKRGSSESECARKLLKKVEDRVKELQQASATSTTLTMQERREFMARVARVDMMTFNPAKDGDLIQEVVRDEKGTKLKLPGKRECIMDDAKLAGELIEKVDQTLDDKRVLPADRRAELLRASIERRAATHGRS